MAEVNESTKIAVKFGTGAAIVVALLGVGRYWGGFETQRASTELRLERNESDIKELRETFGKMQQSLGEIRAAQISVDETIKDTGRVTKALMFEWTDMKVALAERGIIRKGATDGGN